jgi:gliding motility-associated-like protein
MFAAGDETMVSITVFDFEGNSAQCELMASFADQLEPEILCPENINVGTDDNLCGAQVEFDLPEVSDNCPNWDLAQTAGPESGSVFLIGVTTLTFEASDASGNLATCSFDIVVSDVIDPTIECPPNIVTCTQWVEFGWPVATDNCGVGEVYQTDDTGFSTEMDFPFGETILTYEVMDDAGNISGCSLSVTIQDEILAAWEQIPASICETSEPIDFNLLVSAGFNFIWSGDIPETGILDPSVLPPGDYEATLIASLGLCESDSTQSFSISAFPEISLEESMGVCGMEAAVEGFNDIGEILWVGPDEIVFSDELGPATDVYSNSYGTFTITFQAYNGSCFTAEQMVISFDEPVNDPYAGDDQDLYFSHASRFEGSYEGPGGVLWTVEEGSGSIASYTDPQSEVSDLNVGSNRFILTAGNGSCPVKKDTVMITVHDLFIPNGFTPNGDNQNDLFTIRGLEQWTGTELVVFNRWGNEVYASKDYQNSWDGFGVNGKPLTDDTYFFIIKLNGEEHKGYVVLRR